MQYRNMGVGGLNNSNKKNSSYIVKLSRQLTGVLVIILVLMLFKYTQTSVGNNINSVVKESFHKDYTNKAKEMVKVYSPEVKKAVETFMSSIEN